MMDGSKKLDFLNFIAQDWQRNKGYTKGKIVASSFRLANYASGNKILKVILLPYMAFYKFWIEWFMGIEIPASTKIGKGFIVYHGTGLVINKHTVIGDNCLLRHTTTLGNKGATVTDCPTIGNNVNIGTHVCILGKISVGDNSIIGAGSIVTRDVPPNVVVAGNPAKIIRHLENVL